MAAPPHACMLKPQELSGAAELSGPYSKQQLHHKPTGLVIILLPCVL